MKSNVEQRHRSCAAIGRSSPQLDKDVRLQWKANKLAAHMMFVMRNGQSA